jgi:protein-disulfide isomerase
MATRKEWLQNGLSVVLALCALTVTGLLVRQQLAPPPAAAAVPVTRVKNWQPLSQVGNRMGPQAPRLTIVEFSDFQCPFCGQAAEALKGVRERYPQVTVVYRHLPLEAHPHAFAAAIASECAAEQGRFEAFHDHLFANQDSIGVTPWDEVARRTGVADVQRFAACLEEDGPRNRVNRDRAAAIRLGATGTPTFITNGKMFAGSAPPGGWDAWIEENLPGR